MESRSFFIVLLSAGALSFAHAQQASEDAGDGPLSQANRPARPASSPPPVSHRQKTAWLGVAVREVDPVIGERLGLHAHMGLSVEAVIPGSPAHQAGIERFDILTKLDDQWLVLPRQLEILIQAREPQSSAELTFVRNGRVAVTPVILEVRDRELDRLLPASAEDTEPDLSSARIEECVIDNDNLTVSVHAEDHSVVIESRPGGDRYAKVTDASGAILFEGLVTTDSHRSRIPAHVRAKIEKVGRVQDGKWVWQIDLPPSIKDGAAVEPETPGRTHPPSDS